MVKVRIQVKTQIFNKTRSVIQLKIWIHFILIKLIKDKIKHFKIIKINHNLFKLKILIINK